MPHSALALGGLGYRSIRSSSGLRTGGWFVSPGLLSDWSPIACITIPNTARLLVSQARPSCEA